MKQNTVIIYTAIGLELVSIILPPICSSILKFIKCLFIFALELTTPSELIHRWPKLKFLNT